MRKGFTLVELLIVIVVIGVLASMMMLSSTEAVTSAKATKIVSDMKLLQRAALAWYLDNYQRIKLTNNGFKIDGDKQLHDLLNGKNSEITKYFSSSNLQLNNGGKNYSSSNKNEFYAAKGYYALYMGNANTVCYVVYKISDNNNASEETRLKEKLKARAKSDGLLSYTYSSQKDSNGKSKSTAKEYNGIDANVFIKVFEL